MHARSAFQYAAIGGLAVAYNASSEELQPMLIEEVTVALERLPSEAEAGEGPGSSGAAAAAPSSPASAGSVGLALYDRHGRLLLVSAARRGSSPPSIELPFDELLGVWFWSSGRGWWVLLPNQQALTAFQGLLMLWLLVEKGAVMGLLSPGSPTAAGPTAVPRPAPVRPVSVLWQPWWGNPAAVGSNGAAAGAASLQQPPLAGHFGQPLYRSDPARPPAAAAPGSLALDQLAAAALRTPSMRSAPAALGRGPGPSGWDGWGAAQRLPGWPLAQPPQLGSQPARPAAAPPPLWPRPQQAQRREPFPPIAAGQRVPRAESLEAMQQLVRLQSAWQQLVPPRQQPQQQPQQQQQPQPQPQQPPPPPPPQQQQQQAAPQPPPPLAQVPLPPRAAGWQGVEPGGGPVAGAEGGRAAAPNGFLQRWVSLLQEQQQPALPPPQQPAAASASGAVINPFAQPATVVNPFAQAARDQALPTRLPAPQPPPGLEPAQQEQLQGPGVVVQLSPHHLQLQLASAVAAVAAAAASQPLASAGEGPLSTTSGL